MIDILSFCLSVLEDDADRRMLAFIHDNYLGHMERTALSILGSQSDAEDAVQNAFLQIIRHFEKIYSISCEDLPFWIVSIVRNEARTILRKRNRTAPFEDWSSVTAAAEDTSGYRELVALVKALPEGYRAVLEMKVLLGYSDREIAEHLGISETAVSTRASRARALLRKMMEEGEQS